MKSSRMPEFLVSNRASVASEKILEKMRGKSYSAMEIEFNNHFYARPEKNSTPWPWAYFTNGPNAAASIAPTLIRHCVCYYTVSQKNCANLFFVRTLSNLDRLYKFLAQR